MALFTQLIAVSPVFSRWLFESNARRPASRTRDLSCRQLLDLTLIDLLSDVDARRQRGLLQHAISKVPVTQKHLVVDVAAVSDDDFGLHELLETAIALATRAHFSLSVSGVSRSKLAQLELTRLCKIVTCYERSGDAIQSIMRQQSTDETNAA